MKTRGDASSLGQVYLGEPQQEQQQQQKKTQFV